MKKTLSRKNETPRLKLGVVRTGVKAGWTRPVRVIDPLINIVK